MKKAISLVIRGDKRYINHMYHHLFKEHPSTRIRMMIKTKRRSK